MRWLTFAIQYVYVSKIGIYILFVSTKLKKKIKKKLKGYEDSKRYLNIYTTQDVASYWKFVYDARINNIILLEDRFNEFQVDFSLYWMIIFFS